MRLNQQISGLVKATGVATLALMVFASGRPVSASEQNPPAQQGVITPPTTGTPAPVQAGRQLTIGSEDAVRMALENNLGIQAEKLSPSIQALALRQTRASYTPVVFTTATKNSNTNPPSNFLSGSSSFLTSDTFRTNGGVQQNLKWGGARYSASLDGSKTTTNDPTDPFNPRLTSNFNFQYIQPLLRNFKIDSLRQQLMNAEKQSEIVDLQLRQQITQTSRNVRSAYYDLLGAMGRLTVARESLALANQSLKDNERKVEVGTLAPIDIIEAQAEVSRREEEIIVAEASIQTLQDSLRALVLNPNSPDFWTTEIVPSEQPTLTPQVIDVEAAIKNALTNRTDIAQARKQLEQNDVTIRFAENQRLPNIDATVGYGLAGIAGTRTIYDTTGGFPVATGSAERAFSDAIRDIFGNDFKTWSVRFDISYPIGTSQAEAGLAQARIQKQQGETSLREMEVAISNSVRAAGRQVETALKRVEATKRAEDFAQRRYDAEQKRMTVGLSTTFQLFQAQRDLSTAKQAALTSLIDYNRALIDFAAIQLSPVNGR
jgi:outer membrane protein